MIILHTSSNASASLIAIIPPISHHKLVLPMKVVTCAYDLYITKRKVWKALKLQKPLHPLKAVYHHVVTWNKFPEEIQQLQQYPLQPPSKYDVPRSRRSQRNGHQRDPRLGFSIYGKICLEAHARIKVWEFGRLNQSEERHVTGSVNPFRLSS